MDYKAVSTEIPESLKQSIDDNHEEWGYVSRADFLRDAVRDKTAELEERFTNTTTGDDSAEE